MNILSLIKNYNFIEGVKAFKKGINNWFKVALNLFVLKKDVKCEIKNIGTVNLKGGKNYFNSSLFKFFVSSSSNEMLRREMKILKENHPDILNMYLSEIENEVNGSEVITIINAEDGKRFKFLNKEIFLIFETFSFGDYKDFPYCENKSIIDIGANVGDTAIYFANKGYDVYAFEPLPHIYNIAKENIALNPEYEKQITIVNKAVSCKRGSMKIKYELGSSSGGAGEYADMSDEIDVETLSIKDIIEEYDIEPYALKMDCEGCEVNIVKNSDLSMFKEVIMEYHTSATGVDENILIDILKNQGFKVKSKNIKLEGIGLVHLIRQ